jgi:hypothetical protein
MDNETWNQAMQEDSDSLWDKLTLDAKIHTLFEANLSVFLACKAWGELPEDAKKMLNDYLSS